MGYRSEIMLNDEQLWKMVLNIEKTKVGQIIMPALIDSFIGRAYNDHMYMKDVVNPTKEMLDSRIFFSKNGDRLKYMLSKMSDEKSKQVLQSVISYRQSHLKKDRPEYSRKDQYFPRGIISVDEKEVFVDCGAYNGDTIDALIKNLGEKGKCKAIIAFEPDGINASIIRKKNKNITVVEAATWNENTELAFDEGNGSSSKLDDSGNKRVKAVRIDDVPECVGATFIKMDIEGAEYNALIGAKNTIIRNKPKLAICIYHSDEDIFRLFELIDSWNLGYNYYVRHHAQKTSETVLYCVK